MLSPLPKWTIESLTGNNLYLEFTFDAIKHNSNGAGDGYINIFNIVDSLYDATENSVILIDEPEISLHPDLQRKLFKLLVEYSKDRQIIISTHSPYFVDWNVFSNKGKIIRFKKEEDTIYTYELRENTKREIKELLKDKNNPHILDLNANEIFFLNDNVILTEGQEDVICYKEIFRQYNFESNASFFGWGAGGAPKIKIILNILYELGYKRVFTILDNDKRSIIPELQKIFPLYNFYAIVTDDVRNKEDDKLNKIIYKVLDVVVNVVRSFPFLILLIVIQPLTRIIVGKSYGPTATIVPLTLSAAPFIARMVESSLLEVDHGVIEAAQSMGANLWTIIWKVMIGEAKTSLIVNVTIALGTILGYSAMAGIVGGGGLGDIAIRYGYYRYDSSIMWVTVVLLIVLVQLMQYVGMKLSKKLDKRTR